MIYTFDKLMNVVSPINEDLITEIYEELEVTGIGNKFYIATEPNIISDKIRYIGIPVDDQELFRIYEINQRKENEFEDEFAGVDFAIKDLQKDGIVIEYRNNGADFATVISNQILRGSSWAIGNSDFSAKTNESFYYQSRWDCLQAVIEESGCEVQFVCAINNNKISRRYINFFRNIGKETQKRFEYGSNLLSVTKAEDNADVITRIYPRGKGEEIQDDAGQGTGNFTRRITIKDIEWKKSDGKPLDKPKGQEWLEDPELTSLYPLHSGKPRTGVVIYDSCEEPGELIQLGYETLRLNGIPKAEFKVVAPTDSPLYLGDIVTVVNYERIYDLRTRIFKMKRYPLEAFKNEYTFGDEVNRSAYKEVENIIHENNNNIYEYVNGKVISAANGINKVYFGKEFPTKAMKGDLFYKYIGVNDKGEQDIEMWEFDGTTWNKIVDTAMADADRLVKGRIDAGKINVINLNAANITTGILRGIHLEGNTIETSGTEGKIFIQKGEIEFTDNSGKRFGRFYPANQSSKYLTMIMESEGNVSMYAGKGRLKRTDFAMGSGFAADSPVTSLTGEQVALWLHYTQSNSVKTGVEIDNQHVLIRGALRVNNDTPVDFYSRLDMHGYSILNQSDIRLKENITDPTISGIAETKRIKMAEFDFKQGYDNSHPNQQRPTERQFGIIAQSTPFLSEMTDKEKNHYLSVNLNKQVNLNTLTNQELIEKVEHLENRLIIKQKGSRKGYSKKKRKQNTRREGRVS